MYWLVLGFIALMLFVALRRQRVCGRCEHETMRTCLALTIRGHHEEWVVAEDYLDGQVWKQRESMIRHEHVWTNDDWLVRYER